MTYEGPLYAAQRDGGRGRSKHMDNKRDLRAAFHRQLKELWEITPQLRGDGQVTFIAMEGDWEPRSRLKEELAEKHQHYGYKFVPLVTEELDLLCSIDILFLRPDRPGSVVWAGDIDNRLKTLLDALRVPEASEGYSLTAPANDMDPFFVLLEDDKLITRVSVETDRLLAPVSGDNADVRLVLHVKVKPYAPSHWNDHLG
ncbi:MAG: hypothetical protein JKY36_05970 [Erythrobacter sp.]|nr:hypothetical protein [Erythrobacter sp.]